MQNKNFSMQLKSWRLAGVFLLAAVLGQPFAAFADVESDYLSGKDSYIAGDMVGAIPPLKKAADAGHAKAQSLLALILDYSEFDEDAVELYRKSAKQGDPDGMYGYGAMLVSGDGLKEKNVAEGRSWILKAAEQGHLQSINVIAAARMSGTLGYGEADRDTPETLHWAQLAAKNNYLPAVDGLANAYRDGGFLGATQDSALAEEYQAQANRIRGIDPSKVVKRKKFRR